MARRGQISYPETAQIVGRIRGIVYMLAGGGASIVAAALWASEQPTPSDANSPATSSPRPATSDALAEERRKLDDTVWAKERLSHEYEAAIVRFWDALLEKARDGGDQWLVFKAIGPAEITLGEVKSTTNYDHGISSLQLAAPGQTLDAAGWGKQVEAWSSAGYRVVQSDWHHAEFDAETNDAPARSAVTFTIHALNDRAGDRIAVQGRLRIVWSRQRDGEKRPVFDTIDATDVMVFQRTGPAAFEEILTVDPSSSGTPAGVQPILVYDLNGDGRSEIVAAGCNRKYVNLGGGKFEQRTFLWSPTTFFELGVLADFTGDGAADFLSVDAKRDLLLFRGDKDGDFLRGPIGRGNADSPLVTPQVITTGDVDGDGDLDVWLAQYKISYLGGQMPSPYYDANDGFPAFLLRNDGDGKFTDVTEAAGLGKKRFRRSYGSCFIDVDADDDLDLLVVSDFSGIDLYANDGKGNFADATAKLILGERHIFGMSATFGDYNLDGRMDFYISGMSSTTARRLEHMGLGRSDAADVHRMRPIMGYGSRMYLATADGTFVEPPFKDQVNRTGWTWGASSLDFDNDGDRDIYVANGHSSGKSTKDHCTHFWCHDIYTNDSKEDRARNELFNQILKPYFDRKESWDGYQKNALLMNLGGEGFVNIAWLLGVGFEYDGRAVVGDDLDGDGRVDLMVVEDRWRDGQILHVYRNQLETDNHWIGVRLSEEGPGRSPQGALVTVRTDAGKQLARVVTGDSIHAQHATTLHFGLGKSATVESIEVRWPGGHTRRIERPAADQYHAVPFEAK